LVAIGDGDEADVGRGEVVAADVGDGKGDGAGADAAGPLAATCGLEAGAISSLVK